ncbi:hypothetical protein [Actinomadura sp. NPDC049753]|uniref:hypothetical protein n=1 Tax=Actinomadura sp. NPDC049753 TaxID=3154739 RepID=UPI00341938F7
MGSGFKDFQVGEVLGSADVDNYLMKQSVMSFASAAARNAAITSPEEGMCAYLRDVDALTVYTGAAWVVAAYLGDAQSYTPQWTAVTSNPSLGNGAVVGRYKQYGKSVQVYARLTTGSTSGYGSGGYRLSLPTTPGTPSTVIDHRIHAQYFDSSAGVYYPGHCQVSDLGYVNLQYFGVSGSNVRILNADNAGPFTWATGDIIYVFGMYEVA